ncbi:hypothetical protein [Aureimonas jatrophae]|uniref:Uncharacterized protein n=1 Tax=Aureimonas jatrophae TaxID=1166073 RepID=A0A1H0LLY9_9HYPH|nr:hypothetical protein [Aureimonas jatrophae]MBB3952579.1 hypothetical protein [Aureimonas jatrophae]SDO69154.1 hypothetical protein SAMN05192530_11095 [Aureimonas jatrophae]
MNKVVRYRLCVTAAVSVLGAAILLVLAWSRADPADEAPKPIHIAIGMTVRDFVAQNGLSIGEREPHGFAINADRIVDWMPILVDDPWIELTASDGEQSFTFPPGRTLHVSQTAGRIQGLAFRSFAIPKPLEELVAYVDTLRGQLQAGGWKRRFSGDTARTTADFDGNGMVLFGQYLSQSGSVLQMTIQDYGLAPRSESWIIDPSAQPREETRTYLLQITLDQTDPPGYDELIYPRRIFVNGDKEIELPLRVWVDDPDWSPAAAGMVPVPLERRRHYDWSKWEMPER